MRKLDSASPCRLVRPLTRALALVWTLAAPALAQASDDEPHPDGLPPTTAPTSGECDDRMPLWEHVVQEGEHLGTIAGRYGVRRLDLVALNADLENPDVIRPGQKIRVCPEIYPRVRKEIDYVVADGDTLSQIAHTHGLTVRELLESQDAAIRDPDHVRPGQSLRLWIDGGLVEAFQPPPKPARRSKSGTQRRSRPRVTLQLPSNEHIYLKRPHLAWGTPPTISAIERAVAGYKRRFRSGPKVHVGDISKKGGGQLEPHLSHRWGRDVDVGYVLTGADANRTRFSGVNRDNLDVARTWALLEAFLDTHEVRMVFMDYNHQKVLYEYAKSQGVSEDELDELFQYPRGRGRSHGIIRHWRSHRNHFHVRFKR